MKYDIYGHSKVDLEGNVYEENNFPKNLTWIFSYYRSEKEEPAFIRDSTTTTYVQLNPSCSYNQYVSALGKYKNKTRKII